MNADTMFHIMWLLLVAIALVASLLASMPAAAGAQMAAPPVVPASVRAVDSEIGETGLQGADLVKYAKWLSKQRAGDAYLAAGTKLGKSPMYLHRRSVHPAAAK